MTLAIDVATDGARLPMTLADVGRIARAVLRAEDVRAARVSITFVSNRRIASLNRRHLGHRGPTDVISFGLKSDVEDEGVVGDIYIAPEIARRNAAEHGVALGEELTRLVIHGVLHVLGFDHPEGVDRTHSPMWQRQETLLATLKRRVRRRSRSAA